jgi:hypothetical protein
LLRLHAPSIVLGVWIVVFIVDGHGPRIELTALVTVALAVCLHTKELIRMYRRHHHDR